MANGEKEFLGWLRGSQSVFDLVTCVENDLPGDVVWLDAPRLEAEVEDSFSKTFGSHEIGAALPVVRQISEIFTRRIADKECERLGLHPHGLRNAWFCPIYSEFCTLIPMRNLARKLIEKYDGRVFAVPIASQEITCLKSWGKNEMEGFYLAGELRRRNADVFLYSGDQKSPNIQINLSKAWLRKRYPEFKRNASGTAVLCGTAMRRSDLVVAFDGTSRRQRPSLPSVLRFAFGSQPSIALNLAPGPSFGGIRTYSAPKEIPSLEAGFLSLITPLTKTVASWYREKLSSQKVKTCHISDHASFEGGLLAGEVLRMGGKTRLWPHSSNVIHMPIHEPESVAQITVAARSTGSHWVKSLGKEKVNVDPRTILPGMSPPPAYDETHPLTIVLFAGSHMLLRVPLVNYRVHKQAWKRSLEAFARSDIELILKHKSIWETREWISEMAPKGADLGFTNVRANKLMLPNMAFMSISATSTAIFEGIARGIPGFTIQDSPADETPYYDPEFIPRLGSDALEEFLSDLGCKAAWEALRDRQMAWFQTETAPFIPN